MENRKLKSTTQKIALTAVGISFLTSCNGFSFSNSGLQVPSIAPVTIDLSPEDRPSNVANGVVNNGLYSSITAIEGDTMASLAARSGISVEELARLNGVDANFTPRAGQEFIVSNASSAPQTEEQPETNENVVTHVVRPGETIYTIARFYNVSVSQIIVANDLNSDQVSEGQSIVIPDANANSTNTADSTQTTNTETAFAAPVAGTISQDEDGYIYSTEISAPVRATSDGKVVLVSESTGANGTIVMVKHSNGLISVYGRLGSVNVAKDQNVTKGQIIGSTAGGQLLFQLRDGTTAVNPSDYIA